MFSLFNTEKALGSTLRARKAFLAFPLAIWDRFELGLKAEGMEGFIAYITIEKEGFLGG